ncbi:hypothetical protein PIB30_108485 [Stylosanthes scabra]|uniref:Uncharacterized protein n=1 Tax=Stylosanthes scabra TaxID=79078 RepID=A0ABU6W3A3_9FABA|nr:hypothetical protein [Stylosanthes scabra]
MPEDGGRRGGRGEDGGADGGEAGALHLSPMVVRAVLIRQGLVSRARPAFDGRQAQVRMDLNEPASAPSHLFTAYAGTPASAYMHDAHFMDPYLIPPQGPEDPPADDAAGDEGVAPVGRGRRVPRRRGCGTGGHM